MSAATPNNPWPWLTDMADPTAAVRTALANTSPEALRLVEPWLDAWRMPLVWWTQAAQWAAPLWSQAWPGLSAGAATPSSLVEATNQALQAAAAAANAWATGNPAAAFTAAAKAPAAAKAAVPAASATVTDIAPARKAAAKRKPKVEAAPAAKPRAKRNAPPDDLTRIEGIGPKIAQKLVDAGIAHFNTLAQSSTKQLGLILEQAGPRFKLANPQTWAEQAALLARGDEAAFAKLAAQLRGGVRA